MEAKIGKNIKAVKKLWWPIRARTRTWIWYAIISKKDPRGRDR